nr:MAG TPA: hypothetical protein [Caudoviricetes sp.]
MAGRRSVPRGKCRSAAAGHAGVRLSPAESPLIAFKKFRTGKRPIKRKMPCRPQNGACFLQGEEWAW